MAKVKPNGHLWVLKLNWYICFLFRGNYTILDWDISIFLYMTFKIQVQDLDNKIKVMAKVGPIDHI